MSNDRELLELAAKAAGIDVQRCRLDDPLNEDFLINGNGYRNKDQRAYPWNPLTDDGDALRLAVNLNILRAYVYESEVSMAPSEYGIVEPCKGDSCAATRRAIVRAAAEIGKAMP